ncbi:MAG: 5'-nucleotidase C-terminal domain-containing protein [Saprospiraceae bacterium]|nr:5'-nucleotidase C-terminal domain-containing protein [Saprospiraceae bacterium]
MRYLLFVFVFLTAACSRQRIPSQYEPNTTEINGEINSKASIESLIAPYKEGLDAEMNAVIGHFAHDMYKKRPEGELGNFMCDAVLEQYNRSSVAGDAPAQMCFMNYGGIRVQHIPAGDITVGNMFQLMPFENEVVRMELTGEPLLAFLEKTAASGGWPVSKGVEMNIENRQLTAMTINGQAFHPTKTYSILLSDYVANGGDGMAMLKEMPRENTGVKVRDYLIAYCKYKQSIGEEIRADVKGRVVSDEAN